MCVCVCVCVYMYVVVMCPVEMYCVCSHSQPMSAYYDPSEMSRYQASVSMVMHTHDKLCCVIIRNSPHCLRLTTSTRRPLTPPWRLGWAGTTGVPVLVPREALGVRGEGNLVAGGLIFQPARPPQTLLTHSNKVSQPDDSGQQLYSRSPLSIT